MASPASTEPQYHVWWFPGSPREVDVDLQVVEALKERLLDIAAGGSEEGLLFGNARDDATEIVDFQPAVKGTIANSVAELTPERRGFLMGYYRTETAEDFRLNASDLSLVDTCFQEPYQVVLMIHPSEGGAPKATFFLHGEDGRMVDFVFLKFALDPLLLAMVERNRKPKSNRAAIEGPIAFPASKQLPPGAVVERRKPGFALIAGTLFFAAAVAAALILLLGPWHPRLWLANSDPSLSVPSAPNVAQPSPRTVMGLHAARQNGDLEVTWDRGSAPIAAARYAVISVEDGDSKRSIFLDSAQLRSGSLLYSPTSDQVLIDLKVVTPTETINESVTAILPKAGKPQTHPATDAAHPFNGTSQQPPITSPATPVNAAPVKAAKPFVAPAPGKGALPAAPQALPDAPVVTARMVSSAQVPDMLQQAATPPPPRPAAAPQAPAGSQLPPAAAAKAQLPIVDDTPYQPPVPLVKVTPSLPYYIRNFIVKPTTVQVRITVDTNGHVTNAQAVPQEHVNDNLLTLAASAARAWRFQPARRDNKPVISEVLVNFVFER